MKCMYVYQYISKVMFNEKKQVPLVWYQLWKFKNIYKAQLLFKYVNKNVENELGDYMPNLWYWLLIRRWEGGDGTGGGEWLTLTLSLVIL